MIELVHAKLTQTYAATRRPSGMHVGRASVSLSVFQICLSLLKKGRVLDSPEKSRRESPGYPAPNDV